MGWREECGWGSWGIWKCDTEEEMKKGVEGKWRVLGTSDIDSGISEVLTMGTLVKGTELYLFVCKGETSVGGLVGEEETTHGKELGLAVGQMDAETVVVGTVLSKPRARESKEDSSNIGLKLI